MKKITLIMAYYDNPGMLKTQLENIKAYAQDLKDRLELIVVDDCSPKSPAYLMLDPGIPVKIFRTLVDVRWNQDFCRNLAAYKATTDWLLLTDIDHLVPEITVRQILENGQLKPMIAYKFSRVSAPVMEPYKPHPNSWLMSREFYCYIGGYDERFAGNYGTDGDFRDRVTKFTTIEQLDSVLIRVGREVIPDASTTTLERKRQEDYDNINRIKRERGEQGPVILSFPWEEIYSKDMPQEQLA